jgi:hypothetical protein
MEEYSTITTASGPELSQTDTDQNANTACDSTDATAQAAGDPLLAAGLERTPLAPGAGADPNLSSPLSPVIASTNIVVGDPEPVAKPVVKIIGIEEIVRSRTGITSWKPPFEAEQGSESGIKAIIERAEWVRSPLGATPVPTGSAPYGTTDELFNRLQEAIAAQGLLPAQTSALLTYWTFSSWFSDGLSIAPGLAIVGPSHEGDLVLRALRNFCRYPLMMMTGITTTDLKNVNWRIPPTLLMFEPDVTKQMASILGCTTQRGYLVGDGGGYKDFYGPKAIYLGEEGSIDRTPRCSVQVTVHPTTAASAQPASTETDSMVQDLQNQLQRYRLKHLVKVYHSDFDAPALRSDMRTIANALGACIIDSPKLQSDLIALLKPVAEQRHTDRSTSLEGVTLEATLNLYHGGKTEIRVSEVAAEVNRIEKARGERLNHSAEIIGHQMKRVGLSTRRLGKAGKGLVLDLATSTRIHELAGVYGSVGLDQDEKNLHCQLCSENRQVM